MPSLDPDVRARTAYERSKSLTALSGGSIVFLVAFIDVLQTYQESQWMLILALVGLAFTLFVATGIQIVSAAADRWATQTVSPAMLVLEWRVLALAHLSYLISIMLLVSYVIGNIRVQ